MPLMPSSLPVSRWHVLACGYSLLFVTTLWLAYTNQLPAGLGHIPFFDKAGHLLLYAIAVYLGQRALRRRRCRLFKLTLPLFPLLFGLFTVVEEVIQSRSPYRTFDGWDLLCSFVGIAVGYWLAQRSQKRPAGSTPPAASP